MPPELGLILGEFLYQLRAALDNCLYAVAVIVAGTSPPPGAGALQWPICDTAEAFNKQRSRLKYLRADLVDALEAIQPYQAELPTWNSLWLLNDLARVDRHRTLHLVTLVPVDSELIVDFDVHHGNGTQDIFYGDPSVLFFSTHQMPLFPGSGRYSETGRGRVEGYNVNVPLPPGVGDDGYLYVLDQVVGPLLRRYRPDMLLVSAGYDPHWMDPLASMAVTVPGFLQMATRIKDLAAVLCGGKMAWVLEGGYDFRALAAAVEATVRVLAGSDLEVEDPHGVPSGGGGIGLVEGVVSDVRRLHGL